LAAAKAVGPVQLVALAKIAIGATAALLAYGSVGGLFTPVDPIYDINDPDTRVEHYVPSPMFAKRNKSYARSTASPHQVDPSWLAIAAPRHLEPVTTAQSGM
jgi:hypothetical protein